MGRYDYIFYNDIFIALCIGSIYFLYNGARDGGLRGFFKALLECVLGIAILAVIYVLIVGGVVGVIGGVAVISQNMEIIAAVLFGLFCLLGPVRMIIKQNFSKNKETEEDTIIYPRINFNKYNNELVKWALHLMPEENENIRALFGSELGRNYRIFLEEYLCYKLAVAYKILTYSNFLKRSDSVHTEEQLIKSIANIAASIIYHNNNSSKLIPIFGFFSRIDYTDDDTEDIPRPSMDLIKEKIDVRLRMYGTGDKISICSSFKLPNFIADKIDRYKLMNVLSDTWDLVENRIKFMDRTGVALKEGTFAGTFIEGCFPGIGSMTEIIVAVIIYFFVPVVFLKWILSSYPIVIRMIAGIIYTIFVGYNYVYYERRIMNEQGSTRPSDWKEQCFYMCIFAALAILILS